jgi:fibronectin type III domain protein
MRRARTKHGALIVVFSLLAGAGTIVPGAAAGAASGVPGPPVVTSTTPGQETILVAFKKPAKRGSSAITDYRATCEPEPGGGKPATKNRSLSPILVTKVTGGKKYRCTVAAKNLSGYGPESQPSDIVVPTKPPPKGLPDPPSYIEARPAVAAVEVRFNVVETTGGQPVTGYRARCTSTDGKHHNTQRKGRSPILVDNLLEAKAYTCRVQTRNPSGWSEYSKSSNAVVTRTKRPGAPTIKSVTAGVHTVRVAFAPPANPGGTRISSYQATCISSDGGVSGANRGSGSPITVSRLSAKTYRCRVSATNTYGTGPASAPSKPVVVKAS